LKRKCSICKEKGHDKRQCPKTEELKRQVQKIRRDRANVFVGSAFANTLGSAITYALLSQRLQRQGWLENLAGEGLDLAILGGGIYRAEPSMVIGALISQVILETDTTMDKVVEDIITTLGEAEEESDIYVPPPPMVEDPVSGEDVIIDPFPLTGSGTII
jgi:hypothetical protein